MTALRYYFPLLLAQLCVSINIVGAKYVLADSSFLFILCWRFIIATVILLLLDLCINKRKIKDITALLSQINKVDWLIIIGQALCAGALFNGFMLLGLRMANANIAGIITSVLPAIIALFSIIFLKETFTRRKFICIVFAVVGLLLINAKTFMLGGLYSLTGALIILLSLVPEATYYILARTNHVKLPLFFTAILMNAINLPFVIILALVTHTFIPTHIAMHAFFVIMLIGIASAFFYVFWNMGCRYISGITAGMFTAIMPIATVIMAWLCLDEVITYFQLLGMFFVIGSIFISTVRKPKNGSL